MSEFIGQHFTHFLAFVVLISRIGDLLTTYLVSPTLKLEANAVVRRFGWKYAWGTLLIAAIPYALPEAGVVVATVSFLVSASNASKIMAARALGEDEYLRFVEIVVERTSVGAGLLYILMPALFIALLGGLMLILFPSASDGWGFYFAAGFLAYAFAITFWGATRFLKIKKTPNRKTPNQALLPTSMSVTDCAYAHSAPDTLAADL